MPESEGDINIMDVQQGYREEVNHNLFVSSQGNDNNDGLSPSSPLKTIAKALHTVKSDSLNPKTIFVEPGVYSSMEGQIYPLSLKSYVCLYGDSLNAPLLLNTNYNNSITSCETVNASINGFRLTYGDFTPKTNVSFYNSINSQLFNFETYDFVSTRDGAINIANSSFFFDNIKIKNITAQWFSGLDLSVSNGTLKNLTIDNCHSVGGQDELAQVIYAQVDTLLCIENASITNCSNNNPDLNLFSIGGNYEYSPKIILRNVLVANNTSTGNYPIEITCIGYNVPTEITNCTFANNTGADSGVKLLGNFRITNSIFNNETSNQIRFFDDSIAKISNCFVKDIDESIYINNPNNLIWDNDNYTGNPGFRGYNLSDPLSYQLHYTSQLINAGTADTTGLNLPAYDLLGNDRIYGGRIDVGCYEWDGNMHNEQSEIPVTGFKLNNYPNPFNPSTNINFNIPKDGDCYINVYNVKGQLVKSLFSGFKSMGSYQIHWDGKDDNNKSVASGISYASLKSGNKNIVRKMLLMK